MNTLIIWKDLRLFVGKYDRPIQDHKHPIIQFVVGVDEKFKTRIQGTAEWKYKKGLLIKPNYQHECDATNNDIISIEVEPDSALGIWILSNFFSKQSILEYPSKAFETIDFYEFFELLEAENWNELYNYIKKIFRYQKNYKKATKDERVLDVINFIHNNIHQTLTTKQLMNVSFLSESRLLHLFKDEMGIPIRNYILWYRLKVAIEKSLGGLTLTEAAHLAGFSDQSHFTKSCIYMFGLPPSTIVQNSSSVQVYFLT